MYVLDTNTLIYFFKGVGSVARRLLSVPSKEVGVPSIVLYELEVGIRKSSSPEKRIKQLNGFTSVVHVLPFGHEEAQHAAVIRAALEKQGSAIGSYDILIGATAMVRNDILVTHNVREFSRVEGLRIEDWYVAEEE